MATTKRIFDREIEANGFEGHHNDRHRIFHARARWDDFRTDESNSIEHHIGRITVYAISDGSVTIKFDPVGGARIATVLELGNRSATWLASALADMVACAESQYARDADKRRSRKRKPHATEK